MTYLEMVIQRLSTILYNGSQPSTTKEEILDSIKIILQEFNHAGGNTKIEDFREWNKYRDY